MRVRLDFANSIGPNDPIFLLSGKKVMLKEVKEKLPTIGGLAWNICGLLAWEKGPDHLDQLCNNSTMKFTGLIGIDP